MTSYVNGLGNYYGERRINFRTRSLELRPRVQSRVGRRSSLMSNFIVKPLDESTWPDFARLVEKHNGVWGVGIFSLQCDRFNL
jgi:hypothetical protein